MPRRLVALVFAAALQLVAHVALGAEPDLATMERAKALFKQAEAHYGLGEFRRALELYQQAYRTLPMAAFQFNMGQCHRQLGDHRQAVFHYRQFLARAPGSPQREKVLELIEVSEKALADQEATQRAVGARAAEKPALRARVPRRSGDEDGEDGDDRPTKGGKVHQAWFWTTASLGVALLGAGAVTGAMALSRNNEYKAPTTSVARRLELRDSGRTLSTICTGTLIAGGAMAVTAVVLAFFTDFKGRSRTEVSATPLYGGGAALSLSGAF
ncbi:MAG: tetratricopeptide repeat protein [Deltaproteobacteria bacterium]|nr:tetratricopeptide repeat protein [Deltaproteobacteria bacterium]